MRIPFAIIDVHKDAFVTMQAAQDACELRSAYPQEKYRIVNMFGRDDIPHKTGASIRDLTIDDNAQWRWKLTDKQLQDRLNRQELRRVRSLFTCLKTQQKHLLLENFIDDAEMLTNSIQTLKEKIAQLTEELSTDEKN